MKVYMAFPAFFLAACTLAPTSFSPVDKLSKYGYGIHVPPSALHGPGNIVYKRGSQSSSPEHLALGDICSPEYLKFPPKIQRSNAEKVDFSRNQTVNMASEALSAIGLKLSADYTKKVTLAFTNTEVIEYSLEDLHLIREGLGPICLKLLNDQIRAGNAYQVVGAFKADLSYKIDFKTSASIDVQHQVKKELSAKFGIEFSGSQGQVGTGLYYGLLLTQLN